MKFTQVKPGWFVHRDGKRGVEIIWQGWYGAWLVKCTQISAEGRTVSGSMFKHLPDARRFARKAADGRRVTYTWTSPS